MKKKSIKVFENVKMMKNLTNIIFIMILALPIVVNASNEEPIVKSEFVKDGSLDFNVTLSDMTLETTKEYEWVIVSNQAAEAEENDWSTVNDWSATGMKIYLDYSTDPYKASHTQTVINAGDNAYLMIREKKSKQLISDHIVVDVKIPYAYGVVPYYIQSDDKEILWKQKDVFSMCMTCGTTQQFAAVKITDQTIIDGFLKLKGSTGEVDDSKLAEYVDSLNLTSSDVPIKFNVKLDNSFYSYSGYSSRAIGMTEQAIYFVWGSQSYGKSKTIFGVTIYDNNYHAVSSDSNNNTGTSNIGVGDKNNMENSNTSTDNNKNKDNVIQTSGNVKNPSTGVESIGLVGCVLLMVTAITYIVLKRKNKISKI